MQKLNENSSCGGYVLKEYLMSTFSNTHTTLVIQGKQPHLKLHLLTVAEI